MQNNFTWYLTFHVGGPTIVEDYRSTGMKLRSSLVFFPQYNNAVMLSTLP